ncbi:hypothetical protein F5H01DRAFT_130206 [Linnemannia elongata]|nr:hypothetical protein F5H01DRAFT_130206 [Linnemannia elongata]
MDARLLVFLLEISFAVSGRGVIDNSNQMPHAFVTPTNLTTHTRLLSLLNNSRFQRSHIFCTCQRRTGVAFLCQSTRAMKKVELDTALSTSSSSTMPKQPFAQTSTSSSTGQAALYFISFAKINENK